MFFYFYFLHSLAKVIKSLLKEYPLFTIEVVDAHTSCSTRAFETLLNDAGRKQVREINCVGLFQSFPVRSLGWVEMAETDLCEGRSSVAVHHCIRQLSYCRRDIRDSAGVWGEVGLMSRAR